MDGAVSNAAIDGSIRQIVEDFIVDYGHMIDDDRVEEWPGCFTDPCIYRIVNRENHARGRSVGVMECVSRGMLQDRVKALREANVYEPHVYRHLLSGTRIRDAKDGVYKVETSFAIVRTMQEGDVSVFATGKYVDEIVFEDDRPLFRARVVVCDSTRIDTLIVIPI